MKMNVDESPETPMKYNIMSIPTFMIFKNGQIASQFVGVRPQEFVQKEIDSLAWWKKEIIKSRLSAGAAVKMQLILRA